MSLAMIRVSLLYTYLRGFTAMPCIAFVDASPKSNSPSVSLSSTYRIAKPVGETASNEAELT